jgi:small subunit ribosomal protein S16
LAVRLRLTRVGAKKDPVWRIVVADQRSPRDGRVIETIGHYNAQTQPSTVVIDAERARGWLQRGAQPSKAVRKLLKIEESATPPAQPPGKAPAPENAETVAAPAHADAQTPLPEQQQAAAASDQPPQAGEPEGAQA